MNNELELTIDSQRYDDSDHTVEYFTKVFSSPAEIKRAEIILTALSSGRGFAELERALSEEKVRGLYPRRPREFLLYYCFKANDVNENTFDTIKCLDLIKKLYPEIDTESCVKKQGKKTTIVDQKFKNVLNKFDELALGENKRSTSSEITLGDLKKIVDEYSSRASDERGTRAVTMSVVNVLSEIDYGSEKSDEQFIEAFEDTKSHFRDIAWSQRYYVAKYIYYFICFRLLKFREKLILFSDKTVKEVVREEIFDKSPHPSAFNSFDEEFILEFLDRERTDKNIISALLSRVPLMGKSKTPIKKLNRLFLNDKKKNAAYGWSEIKDKTSLFAGETDPKLHKDLHEAVRNLTLEDFYGFKLNKEFLFNYLFEKFAQKEEQVFDDQEPIDYSEDDDESRVFDKINAEVFPATVPTQGKDSDVNKYISGILNGSDMSRSAFLIFLASCKALIDDGALLRACGETGFSAKDSLNLERVNKMLERVGFPKLGFVKESEYDPEMRFDKYYVDIFDSDDYADGVKKVNELCKAVREFIYEYHYSPVVFDMYATQKRAGKAAREAIERYTLQREVKNDAE